MSCVLATGLAGCAARPAGPTQGSQTQASHPNGEPPRVGDILSTDAALAELVIGASAECLAAPSGQPVRTAAEKARDNPAKVADVDERVPKANPSLTADLNNDGVVTLDEIVALSDAGLSDTRIVARLQRTGYRFDLREAQEQRLLAKGVSQRVVSAIRELGDPAAARLAAERSGPTTLRS